MPHSYNQVRRDTDAYLGEYFKSQSLKAGNLHKDYGFLWQTLERTQNAAGKRIRPYLFVLAYESFGGKGYEKVLPVAAALELLHACLLIHDDVIDRDYLRRGIKNVAGIYLERYRKLPNTDYDKRHFAQSAAILGGDLMLSEAYQLIFISQLKPEQKTAAAQIMGEATFVVAGGELLDTEAGLGTTKNPDSLQIAELKTAFYSCLTPLVMGGHLAGASESNLTTLRQIGINFGIAFQLANDMADVFSRTSKTGKTVGGDIREGKRTYLLEQTFKNATSEQKQQLAGILGNPNCTPSMLRQARSIMLATGAKAETQRLITSYQNKTSEFIKQLPMSDVFQSEFEKLMIL